MFIFKKFNGKRLAVAGATLLAVAATMATLPIVTASADGGGIAAARAATKQYHQLSVAKAHGYKLLKDANGVACIAQPGLGTMGIHYVNSAFVGNASEAIKHPEAVIYEPEKNGSMQLVAIEYVVLESAWNQAGHTTAPSLFGQQFMLNPAPNRFGLPAFYSLHAWIWRQNPHGMFRPWNPKVSCHGHG
jgi:hypothetical protein